MLDSIALSMYCVGMDYSKLSKAELARIGKAYAKGVSSRGGKARAKVLTSEQRSAIAKHAAKVRWDRVKAEQEST